MQKKKKKKKMMRIKIKIGRMTERDGKRQEMTRYKEDRKTCKQKKDVE